MIYVTVGTQKFQFDRLIRTVDKLVGNSDVKEEVFIQSGNCNYKPVNCPYKSFLTKDEFEDYISNCSLLITHSGVATIIAGLKKKKPVIVMPRLEKFGEHVDDHQVQIANAFAEQNLILKCDCENDLSRCIKIARNHKFDEYVSQRKVMVDTIRKFINTL